MKPRFDFAALEPLIERAWRPDNEHQSTITVIGKAAQMTGIYSGTIHRWRREGMTASAADRLACALGYHPGLVWPTWWQQ